MAKRPSIRGLGREIYFQKSEPVKQAEGPADEPVNNWRIPLERADFYAPPEEPAEIKSQFRAKLSELERSREPAINKSELIRLAIDLLQEQSELIRLAVNLLREQDEELSIKRFGGKV
jgi:hypothetical protein